jgi:adenosylcobyric acid synthase
MDLQLAEEDAIQAQQTINPADIKLRIAVPVFSRISNHTDFDMLRVHPQVELTFVRQGSPIPPCDLIILPGSKSVRADLALLKKLSWQQDIAKHLRYGGKLLGICGGYQMLGKSIDDPTGVEGEIGQSVGLGYLNIDTILCEQKQLTQDQGKLLLQAEPNHEEQPVTPLKFTPITGYQIHVGRTKVAAECLAFTELTTGEKEGCVSPDNQVAGSYLHGLFDSPPALQQILTWAGAQTTILQDYHQQQEHELERLANACFEHLDWDKIEPMINNQIPPKVRNNLGNTK